ncbi:MAG: DUF4224 domain-containing protein [Thiomonas sp.]
MTPLVLTHAELVEITGKESGAAQCRALTRMGWAFERVGSRPLVSRAYAERRLAGEQPRAPAGFDLAAVR